MGQPTSTRCSIRRPRSRTSRAGSASTSSSATDVDLEVAKGVTFPAWTYNGTAPGPVIRATEGDLLRVRFVNAGSHPHTIHFHGIHPANMDGVFEVVGTGESFTYEFPARPYGMHLYHCHATPLKKHIHKGLYGAFIIDPPEPRRPAQELVMVMNGFDTDADGENNFYTVNGKAFYYAKYPIRVNRSETVRIYLANLTEFDLINSFHLHGDFFRYYPTGTSDVFEYTDTVMQTQGQRGIIEIDFANTGLFMFHAHQSEFAELGWMGFFDVVDDDTVQPAGYAPLYCDVEEPAGLMESGSLAAEKREGRFGGARWRLWALVPIVLLVGVVSLFASVGGSLVDLVGTNPPPADEFDIRRVEFKPGEIRVHVRNPQPDDLTIALVAIDDAIVPFTVEGSLTLGRLASRTIAVPFDWVADDPYLVGVTSSSGIQTLFRGTCGGRDEGRDGGGLRSATR